MFKRNYLSAQAASNIIIAETPDSKPPNVTIAILANAIPIVITTTPTMKAINSLKIESFMFSKNYSHT